MNRDNIEEVLKNIGSEDIPDDVKRIAQETSNNFSRSLTRSQQPRKHILLEYIMRNRTSKLAAAALIIVAVLACLNIFGDNSVAWSTVLENVEQVRSFIHRTSMTVARGTQPDTHVEFTMYRSMDYGLRRDYFAEGQLISRLYLSRDANDCVEVVPPEKKYVKTKLTGEQLTEMRAKQDPRELVKLLTCCAQTPLGRKQINGKECEGIEVSDSKFGSTVFEKNGHGRIWADVETELPVLIELEGDSAGGAIHTRIVLDQFEWSAPMTAEDFEPNIPDDYTLWAEVDFTLSAEAVIKGLRGFSNITGGRYPSSLDLITTGSEIQHAFILKRQREGVSVEQPPTKEEMDNILAIQGACKYYGELKSEDKDVAYYGDKVTAEFPQAVLMRWNAHEQNYCVIFADLSTRTVTPEELAQLEAAPLNINAYPIKSQPQDGSQGAALTGLKLTWLGGAGAVEHRVYFGTSPEQLSLIDTTDGTQSDETPALEGEKTYYWRVDAVSADGTVTQGEVWSFSTARLVAWWKLDEDSSDVVNDTGSRHINGAILGDPNWVEGVTGTALQLDGDGDYVDFGDHPDFDITNGITVSAWIKVNTFDKNWQTIVAKGDSAWRLQRNAGESTLEFTCTGLVVPGSPWGNVYGTKKIDDGQWHYVAGTYDGSQICLYVDGVLDASARATGSINVNKYAVRIGENAEQTGRFWNGVIDDVRIYNYALTADEIATAAAPPQ